MSGISSMMVGSFKPVAAAAGGDQYISNVDTLFHMEGANASTTITNSIGTGTSWAKGAGTKSFINTNQFKFGNAAFQCNQMDSTSTNNGIYPSPYVLANGSWIPRAHWWANDTTCESWVYVRSNTAGGQFAIWYGIGSPRFNAGFWDTNSGASMSFQVEFSTNGTFTAGTGGAGRYNLKWTIGNSILNTWAHLALVRTGNALKLFINGTDQGTGSLTVGSGRDSTDIFVAGNPHIGLTNTSGNVAVGDMGNYFDYGFRNSYIDEFRFSNGIARYTTTFSAPTAAFPDN